MKTTKLTLKQHNFRHKHKTVTEKIAEQLNLLT